MEQLTLVAAQPAGASWLEVVNTLTLLNLWLATNGLKTNLPFPED